MSPFAVWVVLALMSDCTQPAPFRQCAFHGNRLLPILLGLVAGASVLAGQGQRLTADCVGRVLKWPKKGPKKQRVDADRQNRGQQHARE